MKQLFLGFVAVSFISTAAFISSCSEAAVKQDAETPAVVETLNLDSVKSVIAASNKTFGESFATGDSATFVGSYTSDACISPSNMPKMCGTQSINGFFTQGYKLGMRALSLTSEEVAGSKEAIVETGHYELFADKKVLLDKGKYIVIWKEENGKLKMYRDIWNSDLPPAATAKK